MKLAQRMKKLQSAIFAEMNERKKELIRSGQDVIDLSIGAPDLAPAPHIMETLQYEVGKKDNYIYAIKDCDELLEAAAQWYYRRYGVKLDPYTQITSLIGSQDGLAHIALTLVDPGDIVLVPDPGYPIFSFGPSLAGAQLVTMPQRPENGYLIDLERIPEDIARKAKLMVVSYPNNPVTAMASRAFYRELVAFAMKYDIVVLHDNAYSELTFDQYKCGSFLDVEGAVDVGIEFNSLSKTYNMAGCRIGFALGNQEIIRQLVQLKSNIDYGIFLPIQRAGIAALNGPQEYVRETALIYQKRRDLFIEGVMQEGWYIEKPKATMFIWAPIPKAFDSSMEFTMTLMERTGVIVVPGVSFGQEGEGFVRIALVQNEEKLGEAVARIGASGIFA